MGVAHANYPETVMAKLAAWESLIGWFAYVNFVYHYALLL